MMSCVMKCSPMDASEVATEQGFVNALLEPEYIALELLPGKGVPVFSMLCHVVHRLHLS